MQQDYLAIVLLFDRATEQYIYPGEAITLDDERAAILLAAEAVVPCGAMQPVPPIVTPPPVPETDASGDA